MQKRTSILKMISLAAVAASLFACGKANSDAPMVDSAGKHPSDWIARHGAVALVSTTSCTECHANDLSGGIAKVSCMSASPISGFKCHATSPAVNTGCSSCHGTPPNGVTAPNRAGAHGVHVALAGVTCGTCHANAGTGTLNHARVTAGGDIASATVSLPDTLKAKTPTATFGFDAASGTCSSIICHGGQTTPNWYTGAINTPSDCHKCHVQGTAFQTPQYNSFYSGTFTFPVSGATVNLHQLHLSSTDPLSSSSAPIVCTTCHNPDKLAAQHFSDLLTPAFEGAPASTLGGGSTRIIEYPSIPSGTCTNTCHANRLWVN